MFGKQPVANPTHITIPPSANTRLNPHPPHIVTAASPLIPALRPPSAIIEPAAKLGITTPSPIPEQTIMRPIPTPAQLTRRHALLMAPLLFVLTLALSIVLYLFSRSSLDDPILSFAFLVITLPILVLSVLIAVTASSIIYYIFSSKILDPSPNYSSSSLIDQSRQLQLPLPYPDAFDLCLNSLTSLKDTALLLEDRQNGIIEACVLPSLLRYGVRISYRLGSQNTTTTINLYVKNPVPWILIDNGITKRRTDTLTTYLHQHSPISPTSPTFPNPA